ncbi:MAG: hypothetical protein ACRDL8_18600, partial [Solirubrobacteraceae bacterium]
MPTEDPGQTGAVEAGPAQDSTVQPEPRLSPAQLARQALARAKADARARGDIPAGGSARPPARGAAG